MTLAGGLAWAAVTPAASARQHRETNTSVVNDVEETTDDLADRARNRAQQVTETTKADDESSDTTRDRDRTTTSRPSGASAGGIGTASSGSGSTTTTARGTTATTMSDGSAPTATPVREQAVYTG